MAWSGVLLKLFDVGAKWASIAVILNVFAGVPVSYGIVISGTVSLLYITLGGLWADALTDLAQFVVQLVAAVVLFGAVVTHLGGPGALFTFWERLPPGNSTLFNGPYTPLFCLGFLVIAFLSYNGGTWNLAQRYIASPTGSDARKAALLSSGLYLLWPLVMFFPMWAAPLFFPELTDPTQSYSRMAIQLLPPGLIGLVLASMFAHTMAMTTSDANTISAVLTQDIFPVIVRGSRNLSDARSLRLARLTTLIFTVLTLLVAAEADRFGGVLNLLVLWFAALVGPTAVPMILGLLPVFRRSGSATAVISWIAGIAAFVYTRYVMASPGMTVTVAAPALASIVVFIAGGRLESSTSKGAETFFAALEEPAHDL
jgi:SSS family solute:Na+ symporter